MMWLELFFGMGWEQKKKEELENLGQKIKISSLRGNGEKGLMRR